jgi:uncharacterized RDD family membrane protein YckC
VRRALDSGTDESAWLALVEWLDDHDRLLQLDASGTSDDLADYLSTLPLLERFDLGPIAAQSVPLVFAVPRANAILARNFYELLYLEIENDAYPLALVSTEAAGRIRQLAAQLGHVARPIDDGDTDAAIEAGGQGYSVMLPYVAATYTGPRPVNFGKRLLAFLIDAVLVYAVAFASVALGALLNDAFGGGGGPVGEVVLIGLVVYLAVMIVVVGRFGRSFGMFVMGLRLVRVDTGAAPGYGAATGRCLLVALLVFGIWLLVAFITTLVDQAGRGLIDKAAGTLMIDKRHPHVAPATV